MHRRWLAVIVLTSCGALGQARPDSEPLVEGPLPQGWWRAETTPPIWYSFRLDGLHIARGSAETLGVGVHDMTCDEPRPSGDRTCVDRLSQALGQSKGYLFRLRGPLGDGSFDLELDGQPLILAKDPSEVSLFEWADQRAVKRPGACEDLLVCLQEARQECMEAVVFGCAQSNSLECGGKAHATCPAVPEWNMVQEATQPACQAAFPAVRRFLGIRMATVPGSCQVR